MTVKQETSVQSLKKSTARFVRNEVNKTAASGMTIRAFLLEVAFAIAVGLTLSYGCIYYNVM